MDDELFSFSSSLTQKYGFPIRMILVILEYLTWLGNLFQKDHSCCYTFQFYFYIYVDYMTTVFLTVLQDYKPVLDIVEIPCCMNGCNRE